MPNRRRNLIIIFVTFVVMWVLHPLYVRNLEAVIEKRGWHLWLNEAVEGLPSVGEAMDQYFIELFVGTGFWTGVFTILIIWAGLELMYVYWRRRRPRPIQTILSGMSAYVRLIPETGEIQNSSNISSVTDSGSGDFTFSFITGLQELGFHVTPMAGTPRPKEVIANANAARVESVQIKFKNEPDIVDLYFSS